MTDMTTRNRCDQLIRSLDQQYGWNLDASSQERYLESIVPLLSDLLEAHWQNVVINFHRDHQTLCALRNSEHPQHAQQWQSWCAKVIGILRHSQRDWARDGAIDIDDLAQVARMTLVSALPSYRYRSRFSTWAYAVIERSVRDHLRAAQAQRRSGNTTALDDLPASEHPTQPDGQQEQIVRARLLAELIAAVLHKHPDKRLAQIFHLWAIEQRTSAEIGELFHLHPTRVRALLKLARELLRDDPDIQSWNLDQDC